MIETLRLIFAPLGVIARELMIIRELYEADLAQRENPIYRVTEQPKETDTTVTYAGDVDDRPAHKRWSPFGDSE